MPDHGDPRARTQHDPGADRLAPARVDPRRRSDTGTADGPAPARVDPRRRSDTGTADRPAPAHVDPRARTRHGLGGGRPVLAAGMIAAALGVALVGALLRDPSNAATDTGVGLGAPAAAGANALESVPPSSAPASLGPSVAPSAPAASAAPAPQPTRTASATERAEDEVIALVNVERRKQNCDPVHLDSRLRTAARGHSSDMATHDYFSHTGRDGSSPWDRARRAGYTQPSGENIAYGYRTPAEVMRGWMDSEGHRNNILNCSSKAIGVGLAYNARGTAYWTQLFGRV